MAYVVLNDQLLGDVVKITFAHLLEPVPDLFLHQFFALVDERRERRICMGSFFAGVARKRPWLGTCRDLFRGRRRDDSKIRARIRLEEDQQQWERGQRRVV